MSKTASSVDSVPGSNPATGESNEVISSVFNHLGTSEALCNDLLGGGALGNSSENQAHVADRPESLNDSEFFATASQACAIAAFDVLSGSMLQSVVNHVARMSGLSIGLLITSKNGSVVQSAQSGWDASDFRTQSRVLSKIAKESVWRKETRFSSDAFARISNAGNASIEATTEASTVPAPPSPEPASPEPASPEPASPEPASPEPKADASVCLNELSNIIGSSLCSIPYPLRESGGYAVFLCEATPSNVIGVANYIAQASQLWLGMASVANLLKQLDTWLIVRRCSWFAKVVSFQESIRSNSRWWLVVCGLLCGVMFIPVPYYPRRECVFEPETKQYLSSPIQGRIASCEVRPGDYVEKGQLMARLDDDQLRRDLATATAEHDGALKKRDSALATRATGNIALADIEMEQAERRIESIQEQLRRLEIRATSAGVVVQGDWQRNVGMPLTMGQSLFEVAELESMTAEVRLLASDLAQISVGDEVSVRSDASGIASFRGKISRIEPRATVIDDAAVFVADVVIHDPDLQLRPGMKAKAQITAGWRSIGWYLFNRPTQWIANQWIW